MSGAQPPRRRAGRAGSLTALALVACLAQASPPSGGAGPSLLDFTADERAAIATHGPWPPPPVRDASNRADGQAPAIDYGRALFFDPRLSASGRISCTTCHRPESGFQDGLAAARGEAAGVRNTLGLDDVAWQRWFGWDGAHDSLWSASLAP
nr:cytochrome-c peroxidase [Rubrivivax sp.]